MGERVADLLRDLRRVRGTGEQHQLRSGIELLGGPDQMDQPLLPGDPADEDDGRRVQVDAEIGEVVGVGVGLELSRVDPVADDVHLLRIQVLVGVQGVAAASQH